MSLTVWTDKGARTSSKSREWTAGCEYASYSAQRDTLCLRPVFSDMQAREGAERGSRLDQVGRTNSLRITVLPFAVDSDTQYEQ